MNHVHRSRKTKRGGLHRHNPLSATFVRSAPPGRHIDGNNLPAVPRDLSTLPWATRVLVYRDAVTLALADEIGAEEERYLRDLADCMGLPTETVVAISTWVADYEALLARLDALISI